MWIFFIFSSNQQNLFYVYLVFFKNITDYKKIPKSLNISLNIFKKNPIVDS